MYRVYTAPLTKPSDKTYVSEHEEYTDAEAARERIKTDADARGETIVTGIEHPSDPFASMNRELNDKLGTEFR